MGGILEDLTGAACAGLDPNVWDPDMHFHRILGRGNRCWMCDEAVETCMECPAYWACYKRAVRTKESFMICAGYAWTNGRPVDVRKRRS